MSVEVIVFGTGGFGREVAWLAEEAITPTGERTKPVCFMVDDEKDYGTIINGLPVMSPEAAMREFPHAGVAIGIGDPSARRRVGDRLKELGCRFPVLIDPSVRRSRIVHFGQGVIVCAGSILTTNISLEDHVHVNLDCTIGHDVVVESYVTLSPGVHISGRVHIEAQSYLGTGAVVINGTTSQDLLIGRGAIVGAGACVTRDVSQGATVVGVPAISKELRKKV